MTAPFLVTKLYIPPPRPELVSRRRLVERLNAGLERRLTLVSAPAGYGKTTLVVQWLQGLRRPVSWLSLDETDNDPVHFFAYLVAALQEITSTIGSTAQSAIGCLLSAQSSSLPSAESLVTALINDIAAQPTPFVLVLDDYHLIDRLTIHEAVGFLLEHQPPQMHLLIATREDPPLPLSRLRARGQMTELRASDLRFTAAEAAAFLNRAMGLNLTPGEVTALEARTEGWIAGLQLAALSLQRQAGRSEFIRRFAGDDRHVMDYLMDEVLAHQPEAMRSFLLQTSILERFNGPLCDAVVGGDKPLDKDAPASGSQGILERLEQANLFLVPLDNRRAWYRYHHLFAGLLRYRLRHAVGDQGLALLHQRASGWYRRNGYVVEAITHALAASDFECAANLIERCAGDMMARSETITLRGWLEALPEEVIRSRPRLCIHYAWVLVFRWSAASEPIERWLEDAEKALLASVQSPDEVEGQPFDEAEGILHNVVAEEIAVIWAYLARTCRRDSQAAVALSQHILERLAGDRPVRRANILFNLASAYLRLGDAAAASQALDETRLAAHAGGTYYIAVLAAGMQAHIARRQGQLWKAAAICREGLRHIVEPVEDADHPLPVSGALYITLGSVLLEQGDSENADRLLTEGLERIKGTAEFQSWTRCHVALARLRQAQGDLAGALHHLDRVEKLWPEWESDTYAAALRARLWLAQSQLDPALLARAERWAREVGQQFDDGKDIPACADEWRYARCLALVRLRIAQRRAQGQPDLQPVLDFVKRQLHVNEKGGWKECVIELLILQALALDAQGETHHALDALERALALAEPEGYLLIFVDEGPPMARLVYEAARCGIVPKHAAEGLSGRLLASFDVERAGFQFSGSELTPASLSGLKPATLGPETRPIEPLSKREIEVLGLIAEGLSNREVAQRLFISPKTVKRHTSSIYGKLGVHSRTQAVARARALSILPLD